MPITVTLTITKGQHKSKQFIYDQNAGFIIGRLNDCVIVLPEDTVSRYHCYIDIAPPAVMVRDFGSLNGTYLNGKKIGQRPPEMSVEEAYKQANKQTTNEFPMNSGDKLGLGNDCEITVEVSYPPACSNCYQEISSVVHKNQLGQPLCDDCHIALEKGTSNELKCDVCGDVLYENEKRLKICAHCLKDPDKALSHMLLRANKGDEDLADIKGFVKGDSLGEGGMAKVWRVTAPAGKEYALKLMLPKTEAFKRGRDSFVREARLLLHLKHPNVVHAYSFGEVNNAHYILMELCQGGSVAHLMKKSGGKLSIEMATDITLQVLEGLIYTHNAEVLATNKDGEVVKVHGVVHRDIKPANIFLVGDMNKPTVKIADFGLAKAYSLAGYSGFTMAGTAAGSLYFSPRQQAMNYQYATPAVDVWATAASFYYMLTGYCPKNLRNGMNLYDAAAEVAIPIRKRDSRIPRALARVIDKALIDKPEIGVQSAVEFKKLILGAIK